ncbi:1512_t:CDS:2, partial [Scutellospora calospora]
DTILSLITVLRPFTEATNLLRDNKYATISFMYSTIIVIKQELLLDRTSDIDFDSFKDIFDDNIISRIKLALYNAIEYYWDVFSNEAMLAMLLDPQYKSLFFMSESLKKRT